MDLDRCGYKCERKSEDIALSGAEFANKKLDIRDTVQCPASAGRPRTGTYLTRTQTDLLN
jgi:hypothetical protein